MPPWKQLALVLAVLVWSGIEPRDRLTWWLEVAPVLIALPVLAFTWRRFPFTPLAYGLMTLHALILMVGGHYTYAEMPLFNWLRDSLDLARNHYDRLGHLAQGFIPAIVAREILIRASPLGLTKGRPESPWPPPGEDAAQPFPGGAPPSGGWLFFLVTCVCLAISACYELVEWLTAAITGDAGVAFLATQGDVWDTQKDMALALLGAILSQWGLGRVHDAQLAHVAR
jgi:putative membrane protein